VAEKYTAISDLPPLPARQRSGRLRIGYFSSEFRNHPLTHLLAGMFERHDRNRFELFAFSFSGRPADAWTRRVRSGMDHWIDLAGKPTTEAAQIAREQGIDVAVDLTGMTEGCRADVFAQRVAPVQASYIGYLGTMGADYYDYLIADAVIIPPDKRGFYVEKIACLPSFQINDDSQKPSERVFTRAGLGLPEAGIVFGTFNRVYKILPDVFDSWMRILARVPGSVLWLYCGNLSARGKLKAEVQARGIDPARLVFAELLQPDDHLVRLKQADLILDTFPYNSGATASGALRAGVPILTRIGESFAARMGASLLTAVGLPELITETPEAYEDLAVALATDPARLAAIKAKLDANLPGSILFDTERATRGLETLFETMHARAQEGLPPEDIEVEG
jgi:predicted O-linked N-acetylglucosamine transferase (SPINDLY family)